MSQQQTRTIPPYQDIPWLDPDTIEVDHPNNHPEAICKRAVNRVIRRFNLRVRPGDDDYQDLLQEARMVIYKYWPYSLGYAHNAAINHLITYLFHRDKSVYTCSLETLPAVHLPLAEPAKPDPLTNLFEQPAFWQTLLEYLYQARLQQTAFLHAQAETTIIKELIYLWLRCHGYSSEEMSAATDLKLTGFNKFVQKLRQRLTQLDTSTEHLYLPYFRFPDLPPEAHPDDLLHLMVDFMESLQQKQVDPPMFIVGEKVQPPADQQWQALAPLEQRVYLLTQQGQPPTQICQTVWGYNNGPLIDRVRQIQQRLAELGLVPRPRFYLQVGVGKYRVRYPLTQPEAYTLHHLLIGQPVAEIAQALWPDVSQRTRMARLKPLLDRLAEQKFIPPRAFLSSWQALSPIEKTIYLLRRKGKVYNHLVSILGDRYRSKISKTTKHLTDLGLL